MDTDASDRCSMRFIPLTYIRTSTGGKAAGWAATRERGGGENEAAVALATVPYSFSSSSSSFSPGWWGGG